MRVDAWQRGVQPAQAVSQAALHQKPTFPSPLPRSIDNMHSNGVQLTQAGLEFNYAALFGESQRTQLRAAGLLSL